MKLKFVLNHTIIISIFLGITSKTSLAATITPPIMLSGLNWPTDPSLSFGTGLVRGLIEDPIKYEKWLMSNLKLSPYSCLEMNSYFCNPNVFAVSLSTPALTRQIDLPQGDNYFSSGTNWIEKDPFFGEWASDWDKDGFVVTGDFDGNGADDFVHFGAEGSDYLSVAYSEKTSELGSLAIHSPYDIRRFQDINYSIFYAYKKYTIGDFDGDGLKDLCILGKSSGSAYLVFLFGLPNRGGFELRYFKHDVNFARVPNGQGSWVDGYWDSFSERSLKSRVEAHDFDGDGKDDIFMTGYSENSAFEVMYMKGRFQNSSGGFKNIKFSEITLNKPVIFEQSFSASIKELIQPTIFNLELQDIVFGKFNSDNKFDFMLRFYHSSKTYVYLSNGTSGFQLVEDQPANGALLAGVANPWNMKYTEMTGLTSSISARYGTEFSRNLSSSDQLKNKGLDGYISGGPDGDTYISRPGGKVIAGDFNGDGQTDFALLNQVSYFKGINNPFSWDTPPDSRRVTLHSTMPVAFSIGLGKFSIIESDYIGNKQLVDHASRMAVYDKVYNEYVDEKVDGINRSVKKTFTSTDLNIGSEVIVADFNGDGKDDIALRPVPSDPVEWQGGDNSFRGIPIAFSLGDGRFEFYSFPDARADWFAYRCKNGPSFIRAGDFNGDHKTDIALFTKEGNTGASPYVPILFSGWNSGKLPVQISKRVVSTILMPLLLQ